jgi:hypothetical protein
MCVHRGTRPPRFASHHWGEQGMCCVHFDQLVVIMLDLQGAISALHHAELIRLFEERYGEKKPAAPDTHKGPEKQ